VTDFTETNLRNWEARTALHRETYPLEKFKDGWDPLFPIEAQEIGDVSGLDVLHLQCHVGMDSLGLVRRGATVTGVDFSPAALEMAHELVEETGLDARFVEADVYDTPRRIRQKFDLVYSTWGTINWLPDMMRWGKMVATMLKPGGRVYLADGHPAMLLMEEEDDRLVHQYPWRTDPGDPMRFDEEVDYTGAELPKDASASYDWAHPLSSIIGGLIGAGLNLDFLNEHDRLPWPYANLMVEDSDEPRLYRLPAHLPAMPLSFSLQASKPA
jgi:SAM-dependent methyltransferase